MDFVLLWAEYHEGKCGIMTTALIAIGALIAILAIMCIGALSEMSRAAKKNPTDWYHR